jgi:CBS domain-containing protein
MRIGDFLKRSQQLVACGPDDSLETAAKLLDTFGIGAMPVCDAGKRMVGIISERDLVRSFANQGFHFLNIRVRDAMTTKVISCGPDDSMQSAQYLMGKNHIRHLPVVENGGVVGMLSIRDTLAIRLEESEFEINVLRDVVAAARNR